MKINPTVVELIMKITNCVAFKTQKILIQRKCAVLAKMKINAIVQLMAILTLKVILA